MGQTYNNLSNNFTEFYVERLKPFILGRLPDFLVGNIRPNAFLESNVDAVNRNLFFEIGLQKKDVQKFFSLFLKLDTKREYFITQQYLLRNFLKITDSAKFMERLIGTVDFSPHGVVDFYSFVLIFWKFCSISQDSLRVLIFRLYNQKGCGVLYDEDIWLLLSELHGATKDTIKLFEDMLAKAGEKKEFAMMEWQEFLAYENSSPRVLMPAFDLQIELKNKVLGRKFWERCTAKREELSPAEFSLDFDKMLQIQVQKRAQQLYKDPNERVFERVIVTLKRPQLNDDSSQHSSKSNQSNQSGRGLLSQVSWEAKQPKPKEGYRNGPVKVLVAQSAYGRAQSAIASEKSETVSKYHKAVTLDDAKWPENRSTDQAKSKKMYSAGESVRPLTAQTMQGLRQAPSVEKIQLEHSLQKLDRPITTAPSLGVSNSRESITGTYSRGGDSRAVELRSENHFKNSNARAHISRPKTKQIKVRARAIPVGPMPPSPKHVL